MADYAIVFAVICPACIGVFSVFGQSIGGRDGTLAYAICWLSHLENLERAVEACGEPPHGSDSVNALLIDPNDIGWTSSGRTDRLDPEVERQLLEGAAWAYASQWGAGVDADNLTELADRLRSDGSISVAPLDAVRSKNAAMKCRENREHGVEVCIRQRSPVAPEARFQYAVATSEDRADLYLAQAGPEPSDSSSRAETMEEAEDVGVGAMRDEFAGNIVANESSGNGSGGDGSGPGEAAEEEEDRRKRRSKPKSSRTRRGHWGAAHELARQWRERLRAAQDYGDHVRSWSLDSSRRLNVYAKQDGSGQRVILTVTNSWGPANWQEGRTAFYSNPRTGEVTAADGGYLGRFDGATFDPDWAGLDWAGQGLVAELANAVAPLRIPFKAVGDGLLDFLGAQRVVAHHPGGILEFTNPRNLPGPTAFLGPDGRVYASYHTALEASDDPSIRITMGEEDDGSKDGLNEDTGNGTGSGRRSEGWPGSGGGNGGGDDISSVRVLPDGTTLEYVEVEDGRVIAIRRMVNPHEARALEVLSEFLRAADGSGVLPSVAERGDLQLDNEVIFDLPAIPEVRPFHAIRNPVKEVAIEDGSLRDLQIRILGNLRKADPEVVRVDDDGLIWVSDPEHGSDGPIAFQFDPDARELWVGAENELRIFLPTFLAAYSLPDGTTVRLDPADHRIRSRSTSSFESARFLARETSAVAEALQPVFGPVIPPAWPSGTDVRTGPKRDNPDFVTDSEGPASLLDLHDDEEESYLRARDFWLPLIFEAAEREVGDRARVASDTRPTDDAGHPLIDDDFGLGPFDAESGKVVLINPDIESDRSQKFVQGGPWKGLPVSLDDFLLLATPEQLAEGGTVFESARADLEELLTRLSDGTSIVSDPSGEADGNVIAFSAAQDLSVRSMRSFQHARVLQRVYDGLRGSPMGPEIPYANVDSEHGTWDVAFAYPANAENRYERFEELDFEAWADILSDSIPNFEDWAVHELKAMGAEFEDDERWFVLDGVRMRVFANPRFMLFSRDNGGRDIRFASDFILFGADSQGPRSGPGSEQPLGGTSENLVPFRKPASKLPTQPLGGEAVRSGMVELEVRRGVREGSELMKPIDKEIAVERGRR